MLGIYTRDMIIQFNDNKTFASYANGIYDYYDVEQIEEFVAFMGAYEIESLFKTCENLNDAIYRPKFFAILKYCYENYEFNADIDAFIEEVSAVQEETNILQESMEEEIDETMSSLDEKDDEESEEQKEEERISYPCPPSNESNSSTHTLFNSPSCLPKMIVMMIVMIPLILLKYPFLMMLAMLVAKMPI